MKGISAPQNVSLTTAPQHKCGIHGFDIAPGDKWGLVWGRVGTDVASPEVRLGRGTNPGGMAAHPTTDRRPTELER